MFTSENAAIHGRKGGSATGDSFKQQAKAWVRDHGYSKLIEWADGKDSRKSIFAVSMLFGYSLGKPIEKLQIDDRKEIYIGLSKDEVLNGIAERFGRNPVRVLEARDGVVVDGTAPVQVEGAAA